MAGPFPGMDPYVECQGNWPDFHSGLIAEARNALGARLPDDYVARMGERIDVDSFGGSDGPSYRPDVLVARRDAGSTPLRAGEGSATTALEPVLIDVSDRDPEEIRHTWIEIRRLPDIELITVVEVLSPWNKTGTGRQEYLEKRHDLQSKKINLVEIDRLLGGHRVPMKKPLRGGHYFVDVARGHKLPTAEVYSWSIRDRLPAIPIPLRPPDADVAIDLQELVGRVYDLGRYSRTLRHDQPLPQPLAILLHREDRDWTEGIGGGG
jgi:Protein of unknown function (DUF4058)